MLIMPTTTTDFQALADGIVNDFFSEHVPLADGIAKVAVAREFTPEEVTRLTEKTNMAASLFFLKTAADKKATFTLASVEDVLRKTHVSGDEDDTTKMASVSTAWGLAQDSPYEGLPVKKGKEVDLQLIFPCGHTKAASSVREKNAALRDIFLLKKQLEELKQEKLAEELTVQDGIDFLAAEFHVWNGPDFGKFASDSLIACGETARPVIDGLASYLRIPGHEIEKCAAEAKGDHVDDTAPHMQVMAGICGGMRKIVKLADDIGMLEHSLAARWKTAKEGAR